MSTAFGVAVTRAQLKKAVKWVIFISSVVSGVYMFVFTGFLRQYGQPVWDYAIFYTAGRLWLDRADPYDKSLIRSEMLGYESEVLARDVQANCGLLYPPQVYWIGAPFAALSLQTANDLSALTNLALWVLGLFILAKVLAQYGPIDVMTLSLLVLLLGSIGIRESFLMGHPNAYFFASLALSLLLLHRGHSFWAGAVLAVATIKPQTMLFLLPVFAARRDLRMLFGVFVAALVLALVPLLLSGQSVVDSLHSWIEQMRSVHVGFNAADPSTHYTAHLIHIEIIVNRLLGQQTDLSRWITSVTVVFLVIAALFPWCGFHVVRTRSCSISLWVVALV